MERPSSDAQVGVLQSLLPDSEILGAFGNANFGPAPMREVLDESLLSVSRGFITGSTITSIMLELRLVEPIGVRRRMRLTRRGMEYLKASVQI